VRLDGFTLHAATRAGALDQAGREALLRYVLRPPIAQEHLERRPDGLVRITLKKAYADGTVAVDMDPLSLLCRLATSVLPPWFHTVRYAGLLASASPWRSRIAPKTAPASTRGHRRVRDAEARRRIPPVGGASGAHVRGGRPHLSQVPGAHEAARDGHRPREHRRYLAAVGEATEVPRRSPSRGPSYWKSRVLRRQALGEGDGCHRGGGDEAP